MKRGRVLKPEAIKVRLTPILAPDDDKPLLAYLSNGDRLHALARDAEDSRETCETLSMSTHVTLGGAMSGEYLVDEVLDDGRVVLRPDTRAEAINRRLGVQPISSKEFADFVADNPDMLPADEEG